VVVKRSPFDPLKIQYIFNHMVEYNASLDRVFSALSDPTRRAIISELRTRPATLSELARPFSVSFNAISKHVMVLERAGLIDRQIRGREHLCRLRAKPLKDADRWLEHYRVFWTARLDALDRHLRAKKARKG
jgi:DNA-binding transcriptional ArsR family regulator